MTAKAYLHFDTKETKHIDYGDLEKFYTKHYKPKEEYSFVAVEECGNDSSHEFTVTDKLPTSKWNKDTQDKIRGGIVDNYRNADLLNVLCQDGYLPPGEYVIRVGW